MTKGQNVQAQLADYNANDLLLAFLRKEVAFRIEDGIVDVPTGTEVTQGDIDVIAEELLDNDAEIDFDNLDNFINTQLEDL